MEQLHGSPIITEESKLQGDKSIQPIVKLFQKGKQEGLIKDLSMEELLQFTGGAILAYLGWQLNAENRTPASLENQLSLVWDAIKK